MRTRVMWGARIAVTRGNAILTVSKDEGLDDTRFLVTELPEGVEPPPEWAQNDAKLRHTKKGVIVAMVTPPFLVSNWADPSWQFIGLNGQRQLLSDFEPIPSEPDVVEEAKETAAALRCKGLDGIADEHLALAAEVERLRAECAEVGR